MRKLLFENLGLKISAVLLSLILWFFVTSRGQSEMSIEIPVEFKNVPSELGIVSANVKTVNVTVKGQERLMKNIKTSDIRVFVDLERAKKGEGTYYINKDDIKLPYAVSLMNITPSSLKIRLDETVTKNVTVKPSVTGVPEKGFYVNSVAVEPRNVIIYGLKSEIRKVNELRTETLDITGMKETATHEVKIDTTANVKMDIDMVKIKVVITDRKK